MRTVSLAFVTVFALALAPACKDKESAGGESGGGESAGAKAGGEPAAKGPAEMTAPDFFKDFSSLEGMEVMNKYRDGVIVSGAVKRTIEEMDDSLAVWLDAGDNKWISLSFADDGAAAKAKEVKAGDEIKARCKVGGGDDNHIMNTDCELL
jgi:hypothetical protein